MINNKNLKLLILKVKHHFLFENVQYFITMFEIKG